jgi:hypothetical protein
MVTYKDDVVDGRSNEPGISRVEREGIEERRHLFSNFAFQDCSALREGIFPDTGLLPLDVVPDTNIEHSSLVPNVKEETYDDKGHDSNDILKNHRMHLCYKKYFAKTLEILV